jgi:N-acylneuraminate cytidylyltransferase
MLHNKKVIAVIPARGGSKRLPRKNILPMHGKPLIAWTIEAALSSLYIDDVIVTTDDEDIADISKTFGASVPALRPRELASDIASSSDVLFHVLEKYGSDASVVILLQPTSPLRTSKHIDEALNIFIDKSAKSVVAVTPCEHPLAWANTLPENLSMQHFLKPEAVKRSQDLEGDFRLNGALYIYDVEHILKSGTLSYDEQTYAYIMNNESSVDIDTKLDFKFAQLLMEERM